MNAYETKRLKYIEESFQFKLENLCKRRIRRFEKWWKQHMFNHELEIIFGMGTECTTINGRIVHLDKKDSFTIYLLKTSLIPKNEQAQFKRINNDVLEPLYELIVDICEITDFYRKACPRDILISAQKRKIKNVQV